MYFSLFVYSFADFSKSKETNENQNVKESVIKCGGWFLTKKLISPKTNTKGFLQSDNFQTKKH